MISSAMRGCVPESEGKADVPSAPEGWTKHYKPENIMDFGFLRCDVTTMISRRFESTYHENVLRRTDDQFEPVERWRRCLGVVIGKALNHSQFRRSCSGRLRVFGGMWLHGLVRGYLTYVEICHLKMKAIVSSKLHHVLSYNATVSP
jgi:hypothetical protein